MQAYQEYLIPMTLMIQSHTSLADTTDTYTYTVAPEYDFSAKRSEALVVCGAFSTQVGIQYVPRRLVD